jgi:glycine/D-amino acid oxidase-like deaminating enzyme
LKRIPRLKLEVETDREAQLMSLKNIRGGLIGLKCGSLDPYRLAKYYQEQFEELGGEVRLNTPVDRLLITPSRRLGIPQEPLVWQKLRVGAVQTGEGEIRAGRIVLAAGGLTNLLLDPLGVDSHMRPKKRQLFQLRGPELAELLNLSGFNEEGTIPFTILPKSGIYIRPIKPEGCFWVGCADGLGRPFGLDTEPEEEFYQYHIYPVLSKYFPQFVTARVKNAWAGLYAYNTIDRIPYVFESHGILVVTGCSGSGIMKADALGRIVAGLYRGEEWVSLYGGIKFRVADIGIEGRRVEREKFVI